MKEGFQRLFRSCLILGIVGVPILCILLVGVTILALGYAHDVAPDLYNEVLSEWLGLGCSVDYTLSPEDAQRAIEAGFDPSVVADAVAASGWCQSTFGGNIDIGIILSIYENESASGARMGSCDGINAAIHRFYPNHASQVEAARWLLDYWKSHRVRERNPTAAHYIYPDYSGYIGHCGAGEMGGGAFIPTTAYVVCRYGLSQSGDNEVSSCDFWSTKTTFHAIAYWLNAIGYRADQSNEEKIENLYGWNRLLSWRQRLLARADEINGIGSFGAIGTFPTGEEYGESFLGDIRLNIIEILDELGLLPEGFGWLSLPMAPEDMLGITQDWMDRDKGDKRHPGVDFACNLGADILAVADGRVIEPSPFSFMGQPIGFGNHVWIEHPGGLYTVYAHMDAVFVRAGQRVRRGQVIGTCGSTGNSTGPHLHFGVANKHPDEFVSYRDIDPGWVNPHDYLGMCRVRPE